VAALVALPLGKIGDRAVVPVPELNGIILRHALVSALMALGAKIRRCGMGYLRIHRGSLLGVVWTWASIKRIPPERSDRLT
jgi:hypothetical protein